MRGQVECQINFHKRNLTKNEYKKKSKIGDSPSILYKNTIKNKSYQKKSLPKLLFKKTLEKLIGSK